MDSTFRSKQVEEVQTPLKEVKIDTSTAPKSDIEPPYTDYQKMKHHPYIVDHFKLGDSWQNELGGFEDEVSLIDGYFKGKIEQGEMKNDTEAVREKMNSIYKLCHIDKTERTTMQIEKLAAYIKFLKETDDIKLRNFKYGSK